MQTVTVNPSIAAIVNINPVGKKEVVPIFFTAGENWVGTYDFKIFNSDKKNTEFATSGTLLEKVNAVLTLTIDATTWSLPTGMHYYEITKTEDKRVVFKGVLNIID